MKVSSKFWLNFRNFRLGRYPLNIGKVWEWIPMNHQLWKAQSTCTWHSQPNYLPKKDIHFDTTPKTYTLHGKLTFLSSNFDRDCPNVALRETGVPRQESIARYTSVSCSTLVTRKSPEDLLQRSRVRAKRRRKRKNILSYGYKT